MSIFISKEVNPLPYQQLSSTSTSTYTIFETSMAILPEEFLRLALTEKDLQKWAVESLQKSTS